MLIYLTRWFLHSRPWQIPLHQKQNVRFTVSKAFCGLLWRFLSPFLTLHSQSFVGFLLHFHERFPGCQICNGTNMSILSKYSAATWTTCSSAYEDISLVPERKGKTVVYFVLLLIIWMTSYASTSSNEKADLLVEVILLQTWSLLPMDLSSSAQSISAKSCGISPKRVCSKPTVTALSPLVYGQGCSEYFFLVLGIWGSLMLLKEQSPESSSLLETAKGAQYIQS